MTSDGTYLYAFQGGSTNFWKYDVANNHWRGSVVNLVPSGSVYYGGGAVYLGGYVYVAAGNNTTTFYRYTVSTGAWTTMASTPGGLHAIYQNNITTDGTNIFVIRYLGTATVYKYTVATNTWSTVADAPAVFCANGGGCTLTSDGTYLYAFQGGTTAFWRYDIAGNSWTTRAVAPAAPYTGAGLVYDGGNYIYALPGYVSGAEHVRGFWRYDIAANTWSSNLAETPDTNATGGSITYRNGIVYASMQGTTQLYAYNVALNSWSKISTVPSAFSYGAALTYDTDNNKIYATRGAATPDFYRITPGTTTYQSSGYFIKRHDFNYVASFGSLTSTTTTPANTSITFQTRSSTDSGVWSAWQTLSSGNIQSTAQRFLEVKATLASSDGVSSPTLSDYTVNYTGDTGAPSSPTISGYDNSSLGTALSSGSSYFYPSPYFSWPAAIDSESTVSGYFVYFGSNVSADPATAGNLQMGTSFQVTETMTSGTTYYLRIKTKDFAGNTSSSAASFTYAYTGVSPVSTVTKTSQADFTAGTLSNTEATSSAGSLKLARNELGRWSLPGVPTAVYYGGGAVYLGGYVYVAAGNNTTTFYRYTVSTGAWTTMASTPGGLHAIYQNNITTDGTNIFVIRYLGTATVYKYTVATNTWSTVASAPGVFNANGGGATLTSDGTYVYAFQGGGTAFWRYLPATDTWSSRTSAPFLTNTGAGLAYDGGHYIYATPGYDQSYGYLRRFWRYDITTDTWSTLTDTPFYNSAGGALSYRNGKVYALPGNSTTSFYEYDPTSNAWTKLTNTPGTPSYGASLTYDGITDKIYATRGANSNEFWAYDPTYNEWQNAVAPSPVYTTNGAGLAYDGDDTVYVLPVNSNAVWIYRYFYKYSISANTWTRVADSPNYASYGTSLAYDGTRYIYALRGGSTAFWRYDTTTNNWTTLTTTPSSTSYGNGLIYNEDNGKLYALRGGGTTDFWEYDINSNAWTAKTSTADTVHYSLGLVYDGNGYIYTPRGYNTTTFYRYNVAANTWSTMAAAPATIYTSYGGNIMTTDGTSIWMPRSYISGAMFKYDIPSNSWTTVAAASNLISYNAMVKAGNRVFTTFGQGTGSAGYGWYWFLPPASDKAYENSGTYTSDTLSLGKPFGWAGLEVNMASPSATRTVFETRSSTDSATWSSWSYANQKYNVGSDYSYSVGSAVNKYLQVRAKLFSTDNVNTPSINSITLNYYNDETAPSNPTTISGYDTSALGTAITTGAYRGYANPYFTWSAGSDGDGGSGVAGYYLFMDTDEAGEASASATLQTTTNYTASSLISGTPYYLRVQTKDNNGNYSATQTKFTYTYDGTAPSAPATVTSTSVGYSVSNSYTFYWPATTDTGGSGLAGYQYKTGTESGALSDWQNTTGTSVADIPAYQSGENTFYLRAYDNAGNYSSTINTKYYYNAEAPTAPTSLTITPSTTADSPSSTNSFTVTWGEPATYSGAIAKYYYCVNCTPSALTMSETSATQTVDRTITATALATQQGKNTFYIVAEDNTINTSTGLGNRNFDAYATADFYASTTAPGAPTSLTVTDASDKDSSSWRLTLAWKVAASGGTPARYDVYKSTDNSTFTKVGSTTSTAYTDADLTQSTKYYYKVQAVDNAGATSLYSNTVNSAPEGKYTSPPTTGGTPSVTVGAATATVTWTTSRKSFGSVDYGKTTGYGSNASEATQSASHSVKISGLTPGETYHYRVQNLDDSGLMGYSRTDAYSADYSFTTQSTPSITGVEVTDETLTTVVINWSSASLASSEIEYGTTTDYGAEISVSASSGETLHTGRIADLTHSTTYHFRIRGIDLDGNDVISDDYTFSTLTYPKVTAVVLNTDQGAGGTSVILAWATNVATTGQVDYQGLAVDQSRLGSEVDLSTLSSMSQARLSQLPTTPKTAQKQTYSGKLETKHLMRLQDLEDGAVYVFTISGRDGNGNEVIADPIRYVTGADTRPPVISNVVIETPMSGVGSEAKTSIIVSWDTDEPALGQVVWGTGTGTEYSSSTEKDQELTTKHVMVIRDLQPTSTYHLKVTSTDKTGNTVATRDTVVVTPTSQQAAFDVILANLEDIFGFLKL